MPPRRSTRPSRSPSKAVPKLRSDRSRPDAHAEETFDIHTIKDSSDEGVEPVRELRKTSRGNDPATTRSQRGPATEAEVLDLSLSDTASQAGSHGTAPQELDDADTMEFEDVDVSAVNGEAGQDDDEQLEMEDVDLEAQPQEAGTPSGKDGLRDMYAAAYQQALHTGDGDGVGYPDDDDGGDGGGSAQDVPKLPIYKDGKGQHRGVEISMGTKGKKQDEKSEAAKKRAETMPSARDRQSRINAHKLYVLSILAFARIRNKWCNDDALRDHLINMVPDYMVTKLKAIHPKKVPEQRERVRMFESFITELTKWWVGRFRLDAKMTAKAALRQPDQDIPTGIVPAPGRRIDGWIVESAAEREKRHRKERQERVKKEADAVVLTAKSRKGKGKADGSSDGAAARRKPSYKPMEITLFMPGTAIRPVFLSLLPPAEPISSPADLLGRAQTRSGSRETSAQLFCALCRSLGIPARLVVSVQPMPWSVGASKLANTASPTPKKEKSKAKSKLPSRTARFNTKPDDELTSDDEDFDDGQSSRSARSAKSARSTPRSSKNSRAVTIDSDSSLSDLSGIEEVESPRHKAARNNQRAERDTENLARKAVLAAVKSPARRKGGHGEDAGTDDAGSDWSAGSSTRTRNRQRNGAVKGKGKATEDDGEEEVEDGGADGDYRPAKWRNLDAPLKVEPKAKLRRNKPKALKATEVAPADESDVEPVDLQAPPTVWVEVFSKPFQKWITIDPIRSVVRASGNRWMEPSPSDKQNKLVYVVAVEEDGFARDVTARYTNKLNSRVARLRPPTRSKNDEDWWVKTSRAIHRPQRLDRDAMEDIELNDSASKEAMPTSVAGYKDHPVYFLEKHLKRDEVIHPRNKIATFQGMPVFKRSDVLTLRSSRQWFNEGRVVKDGEVALKWVKSRGYTLANKRAEEQAKAEGREAPNEGLYAEFQTELYVPPPIVDGKIPTNAFGNIDLFVPSMLPKGAAHIPYNGATKVAKKLGISYAEAITGFEFRKHRGMPKITGIVVPIEHEQMVLDAYWEHEHLAAERESTKRQERAIKAWKKLLNALRIAKRVKEQYGDGSKAVDDGAAMEVDGEETATDSAKAPGSAGEAGGFFVEDNADDSPQVTEGKGRKQVTLSSAASSNGIEPETTAQEETLPDQPASEVAGSEAIEEEPDAFSLFPTAAAVDEAPAGSQDTVTKRRTGPIVSLSSLIEAETNPAAPPATGNKIKLKVPQKRSRRKGGEDEEEGDDDGEVAKRPAKSRRQSRAAAAPQPPAKEGTRRSSRRSAASSSRGIYDERSDGDE